MFLWASFLKDFAVSLLEKEEDKSNLGPKIGKNKNH